MKSSEKRSNSTKLEKRKGIRAAEQGIHSLPYRETRKIQVSVKQRARTQKQLSMAFTDAHREMIHRLWDPIKRELGHSSKHGKEEVSINLVNNLSHGVKVDQELC